VHALWGSYASVAGAAFAAHCGAEAETRVVRSVLDLPGAELPEPRVPTGFRLLTWLACVPDERLSAFVEARAAMDDAPEPEEMDIPGWTAETVRASEASLARRQREMRLTVAIDNDGAIGSLHRATCVA